ncbi:putative phage abortive infection protein [Acinetobacter sp.]|uniref:putative phage abortive infection protein n=1 Tax=Acinetobacter sp. TaxID=472 RepID=UPI00389050A8
MIEAFYELVKTIERRFSSAEFLTEKQRDFYIKQYCNMVRLSLSQDMLYLILLDIIKEENKKLKEFCEKNNIFKYISLDNAPEPELKLFIYHLLAQLDFLENTLNKRFKDSLIFNFLKYQDLSFYTLMKLCLPLRQISNTQKIEFKLNNEFYEIFYDRFAQQWIFENCILKNIQFVWDSIILDFYKKDKTNWDVRLKLSLEIRNNFLVCIDIKKHYSILK